jgi:hypothetical protein
MLFGVRCLGMISSSQFFTLRGDFFVIVDFYPILRKKFANFFR